MAYQPPRTLKDSARLLSLLQSAHAFCEAGDHPTDAVVKVARQEQLSPEMTVRVVHTLNKSLMQAHRLSCETGDLICKTATFPIANEEQVLARVFQESGRRTKSAGMSELVSAKYAQKPEIPEELRHRERSLIRQKLASSRPVSRECSECARSLEPADQRFAVWKAHREWRAKRAEYVIAVRQAERKTLSELAKFAAYFQQPRYQRKTLGAVARHLFCADSDLPEEFCKAALDWAQMLVDPAERRRGLQDCPTTPLDWNDSPFVELRRIKQALEQQYEATRRLLEWEQREPVYLVPSSCQDPERSGPLSEFALDRQDMALTYDLKKLGGTGFGSGLLGGVTTGLTLEALRNTGLGKSTRELASDVLLELSRPEHQLELDSIKAQVGLSNLMRDDEVISGYSPQEVVQAYNEIAEIAPIFSKNIATVRPFLRRRLTAGTLDSFDIKELINAEYRLNRQMNSSGSGKEEDYELLFE